MITEIITTGTELLLGEILNTNSAYLSKKLNHLGFDVLYQSTVGDNKDRMYQTIQHALSRADIVITSGGLGPTQGDITKEISSKIMNKKLIFNNEIAKTIENRFLQINKEMTSNNLKQAYIPENTLVFSNTIGTAPGLCFEKDNKILINLPGPPRELRPMFEKSVLPFLKKKYNTHSIILSRILNIYGIGESSLETLIKDYVIKQTNPTIALLVRPQGIILRLTAKSTSEEIANQLLDNLEYKLRNQIGKYIYSINDVTMEEIIIKILQDKKLTLSCAESCTGGLLSNRLTNISGASNILKGSIVAYTNNIKEHELCIDKYQLKNLGAVNDTVANQLATNIRNKYDTDIGIGITGFAEPKTSLSSGIVFISISSKFGNICTKNIFTGSRQEIKYHASQAAFDMLRHYITKNY